MKRPDETSDTSMMNRSQAVEILDGLCGEDPESDHINADILLCATLRQLGASDVAEACRFLIQCEWITGAVIKLNGGMA